MTYGIIGTGSIGHVVAESLIASGAALPEEVFLHNRTHTKALAVQQAIPGAVVCRTMEEVASRAPLLFVCVRQPDVRDALESLAPFLTEAHCVLLTTSAMPLSAVEEMGPCSWGKVIPSMTNAVASGGFLYEFAPGCSAAWKNTLKTLFSSLAGTAFYTEERVIRAAADLTGCGPAFFAKLALLFARSAAQYGITEQEAEQLAREMLIGLGELLAEKQWTLGTIVERTAAKGGVTARGLEVIDKEAVLLFDELSRMTQKKAEEDRKEAAALFGSPH